MVEVQPDVAVEVQPNVVVEVQPDVVGEIQTEPHLAEIRSASETVVRVPRDKFGQALAVSNALYIDTNESQHWPAITSSRHTETM